MSNVEMKREKIERSGERERVKERASKQADKTLHRSLEEREQQMVMLPNSKLKIPMYCLCMCK